MHEGGEEGRLGSCCPCVEHVFEQGHSDAVSRHRGQADWILEAAFDLSSAETWRSPARKTQELLWLLRYSVDWRDAKLSPAVLV